MNVSHSLHLGTVDLDISLDALKHVLPNGQLKNVSIKDVYVPPCLICPLAKQKRLSFHSPNHLSEHCFDLLHCNVSGPYQSTHTGCHYFLTLVDDFSRYMWVFFFFIFIFFYQD